MTVIATVENAILTQALASMPAANVVRDSGSLPGGWTLDMLRNALQFAPGIYVAFTGGKSINHRAARIDAQFVVYAVTKEPLEISRRTGNRRPIGAYEMIESICAGLHQFLVPNLGSLDFVRLDNLFRDALFNLGGTVYAATFGIGLEFELPEPNADIFTHFHADYDIDPLTQTRYPTWLGGDRTTPLAPDAQDDVSLDGAP